MGERTCIAICRQERSGEDFIRYDTRRGEKRQLVLKVRFVKSWIEFSSFEWNRVTVKSCSDLVTFIVGGNC